VDGNVWTVEEVVSRGVVHGLWVVLVTVGVAAVAVGCTGSDSARSCERTSECRVGEVCASGVCRERSESITPSPNRDVRDDEEPPQDVGMSEEDSGLDDIGQQIDGGEVSDVAPDIPAKMYPDCDGDGFGTDAPWAPTCETPEMVTNAKDCNDIDDQVPVTGNLGWYEQPHTNGNGESSFDYECDGEVERRFTEIGICREMSGACLVPQSGWLGTVPDCGKPGGYVRDGSDCMSETSRCIPEPKSLDRVQQCR
jgi:hypothetical protein